jgi:glycerol dehydrogenase
MPTDGLFSKRRAIDMKKVLIAPRKYVQGRGVLSEAGTYVAILGTKTMVLWDPCVKGIIGDTLLQSLADAKLKVVDVDFHGESSRAEVDRVVKIIRDNDIEVTIGVGGGKTLDTAKAAAHFANTRVVTIPTIASTDTPTSSATVWYDEQGNCEGFDCWKFNPDLVLVDSQVIASGPIQAFVSGMGDALATWIEAEAAYKTRATNLGGGTATMAAMTLASLCYETVLDYGIEAKRAVEQNVVTPAVEKVIEANVLLSGLGFESGGLATVHMIANALSSYPECKDMMHGDKVGFGIISQLCLDDEIDTDEIYEVVDFEVAVGLPVTFEDLGLKGATREKLQPIADVCAGPGSLCETHPFPVTADDILDAMIAADQLGQARKKLQKND